MIKDSKTRHHEKTNNQTNINEITHIKRKTEITKYSRGAKCYNSSSTRGTHRAAIASKSQVLSRFRVCNHLKRRRDCDCDVFIYQYTYMTHLFINGQQTYDGVCKTF